MCHFLGMFLRVPCFWPHQELQAKSLKLAPRALCSVIVVHTQLCFSCHFQIVCVVSEFVLGAHSWLFGERRLLQLLALVCVLEVMETEMGGAAPGRSPWAQQLFLSATSAIYKKQVVTSFRPDLPDRFARHRGSWRTRRAHLARGSIRARVVGRSRRRSPRPGALCTGPPTLLDPSAGFTLLPAGPSSHPSVPSTSLQLHGTPASLAPRPRSWRQTPWEARGPRSRHLLAITVGAGGNSSSEPGRHLGLGCPF